MNLETYRRKDKGWYSALQDFLDEVGEEAEVEVPQIYETFSRETAQIERLTVLSARRNSFEDQFNHQEVVAAKVFQDTPLVLGVKLIIGQPKRVYLNTSFQPSNQTLNPRTFDWRPTGDRQFEVLVHFLFDPGEPVECTFDVWGD
jgi:hypothetical protein